MMKQLIRKVRELQHVQAVVCLEKKHHLKKTNLYDIGTNNNSNNSNNSSGSSDVNTVETVMKHNIEHLINMDNLLEEAICYTDTIYQQSSSTSGSSSSNTSSTSTIDYNVYNNNHIYNHQHQHIHLNNQYQYNHNYNQPQQFNYNSCSSLNNNSDYHHHLNYRVLQPPLPQQPPPPKLFQPSMTAPLSHINAPLSHINAPLSHINIPFSSSNAFFPRPVPTFKFLPPLPTSQPPIISSPTEIPQSISPSLVASSSSSSSIPSSQSLNESDPYDYTKILLSTITKIKQNICETVDDDDENKDIKITDGNNHENEDTTFALKKRKSKWDS